MVMKRLLTAFHGVKSKTDLLEHNYFAYLTTTAFVGNYWKSQFSFLYYGFLQKRNFLKVVGRYGAFGPIHFYLTLTKICPQIKFHENTS